LAFPVTEGKPFETETRVRRFDGEYRWFLSRACPLFDRIGNILGWSGNDTDIDDRKQAEEKLRQDETELRRITDAIPQAITVLGPEGNALYANRVALEYTGLTLEDVNGGAFRTQVFLHSHESEHFRNEPKKLRAFVTSRTFVIQTSINQFIFSNLRLEP
jgi:PAS domain-containing protein